MVENKKNPNALKIVITWDGEEGENQSFRIKFSPDPLNVNTNLRNHLVVLANAFVEGTKQLMSLVKPLPQPTEDELKEHAYNFAEHEKEYGEGLFALYNYKKALMEEFVTITHRVIPDAFHDVLYVKGAQEKIFDKMREDIKTKKEAEQVNQEKETEDLQENNNKKGMIN